jgi:hypothetical protein
MFKNTVSGASKEEKLWILCPKIICMTKICTKCRKDVSFPQRIPYLNYWWEEAVSRYKLFRDIFNPADLVLEWCLFANFLFFKEHVSPGLAWLETISSCSSLYVFWHQRISKSNIFLSTIHILGYMCTSRSNNGSIFLKRRKTLERFLAFPCQGAPQ